MLGICQMSQNWKHLTLSRQPSTRALIEAKKQSLKKLNKQEITSKDIPKTDKEARDTFTCIQEHWVEMLNDCHGVQNLLVHISHVCFPKLAYIGLWNSKIESVEVLSRIHIPQLKELWINQNNISFVKALRKADFPNLKDLRIHKNKFSELNGFIEANFPCIGYLSIELWPQIAAQDMNCLLKLRTNKMKTLLAKRQTRIDQPSTRRHLQAKFPGVNIQCFKQ